MTASITTLVPLSQYRDSRAQVFPSETSLDWFLRKQRKDLIAAGALLMIAGRWMAQPHLFDDFVIELGRKNALERARAGDAGVY